MSPCTPKTLDRAILRERFHGCAKNKSMKNLFVLKQPKNNVKPRARYQANALRGSTTSYRQGIDSLERAQAYAPSRYSAVPQDSLNFYCPALRTGNRILRIWSIEWPRAFCPSQSGLCKCKFPWAELLRADIFLKQKPSC